MEVGVSEEVSDPDSDALSSVAMNSDVGKCSDIVPSPILSLSGIQDPPAASWKTPLMTNNGKALPFTSPHLYYSFHYCNTIVTVCHPGLRGGKGCVLSILTSSVLSEFLAYRYSVNIA